MLVGAPVGAQPGGERRSGGGAVLDLVERGGLSVVDQ